MAYNIVITMVPNQLRSVEWSSKQIPIDGLVPLCSHLAGGFKHELALEYGQGLAARLTAWWMERTKHASSTSPCWLSFAHPLCGLSDDLGMCWAHQIGQTLDRWGYPTIHWTWKEWLPPAGQVVSKEPQTFLAKNEAESWFSTMQASGIGHS
jgi:hypothetical protein